jgi:hypothetical protein
MGHPFEFIFGAPDPEQQAEMQRQVDQAHMQQQSLRHEVQSFVDNLDEDGLRVLRAIVHAASGDENYGSFVQGCLTTMLHVKYGLCAACGKNHDKELLGDTSSAEPVQVSDGTEQPALDEESSPAEWAATMAEYNLRLPNPGEVDHTPDEKPVICIGCNTLYQSLEDRTLRPKGVDGCWGCQHKAAFG